MLNINPIEKMRHHHNDNNTNNNYNQYFRETNTKLKRPSKAEIVVKMIANDRNGKERLR